MSDTENQDHWKPWRKALGVRQDYFARKTGIYRTKLSNWERGKLILTPDELGRLADAIDAIIIEKSESKKLTGWEKLASPKCIERGSASKILRNVCSISQVDLAEKLGITQSALSLFENGYADLSDEVLERLNEVLSEVFEAQIALAGSESSTGRQPSVPLRALLDPNRRFSHGAVFSPISASIELSAVDRDQNRNLRKQIEIMKEIIQIQDDLITQGIDGPALVAEAAKKDAEIAALKQRVKDLMEMYDIGSQAVAATARYEELREKVQKPVITDEENRNER